MNPRIFVIVLLHFSLANADNFTQVFEWTNGMDYVWPYATDRRVALEAGTFKPENIEPTFMAVYGTRIFLSLNGADGVPVTLVSLPTSSESSAPPKLTPFPSWEMHVRLKSKGKGGCNKIEEARGLQVDSVGRLWVVDSGSWKCNVQLWIFNLSNNHTEVVHRFTFRYNMQDLALEETPNGTLAYIAYYGESQIVVFSLERKESWIVETPGLEAYSIAMSPKEGPRKLYLSNWNCNELYSISVDALRKGTETANPKLIGKWSAVPYRMLFDSHGTMYAAFKWKNYIRSCNISQPFEEQPFYEVEKLNTSLPFTLAVDSSGTFWMTELNKTATKPRFRLLKSAVRAMSITTASPTTTTIPQKTEPGTRQPVRRTAASAQTNAANHRQKRAFSSSQSRFF